MARRDRIGELIAIKQRGDGGRHPDAQDVHELRTSWTNWTGSRDVLASLIPARLVTLIEVVSRYWLRRLIDEHGLIYVERIADLNRVEIKYDLPLVRSLQGQTFSLGFLIAQSVPLANFENLAHAFTTILARDFFDWLSEVRNRLDMHHEADSSHRPIVDDIAQLKRILARLFQVRHVLVHEFPATSPIELAEIDEMLNAVETFIFAAEEGFLQLLHGFYPISQADITAAEIAKYQTVDAELQSIVGAIASRPDGKTIREVQKHWRAFAEADANWQTERYMDGSLVPSLYNNLLAGHASERVKQLRKWLDDDDLQ